MKKAYISGQITGLHIDIATAIFEKMEKHLKGLGYEPINPMKILPYHPDLTWQDYMKADIKILCDCHVICMLPNWVNSKGAKWEHDIAKMLGLEIQYLY